MLFLCGQKWKQSVCFAAVCSDSLNGTAGCDVGNAGVLPHLDQTQKCALNGKFLHVFCGHHLGVTFLKKILSDVLREFFSISRIWFQKMLYNVWPKCVLLFGMVR